VTLDELPHQIEELVEEATSGVGVPKLGGGLGRRAGYRIAIKGCQSSNTEASACTSSPKRTN